MAPDWTWILSISGLFVSTILVNIGGLVGSNIIALIGKLVGYTMFFIGITYYYVYTGHDMHEAYTTSMVFTGFIMFAGSYTVMHLPWGVTQTIITSIIGYILSVVLIVVGFIL